MTPSTGRGRPALAARSDAFRVRCVAHDLHLAYEVMDLAADRACP